VVELVEKSECERDLLRAWEKGRISEISERNLRFSFLNFAIRRNGRLFGIWGPLCGMLSPAIALHRLALIRRRHYLVLKEMIS
jgi:hypothetical protein